MFRKKNSDWEAVRITIEKNMPIFRKAIEEEQSAHPEVSVELHARAFLKLTCRILYNKKIHKERPFKKEDNKRYLVSLKHEEKQTICNIVSRVTNLVPGMIALRCDAYATERTGIIVFKIGPSEIPKKKKKKRPNKDRKY